MTKRLIRLEEALEQLEGLVLREDLLAFFDQPNPTLMHARPIDLLETDAAPSVIALIESVGSGAF